MRSTKARWSASTSGAKYSVTVSIDGRQRSYGIKFGRPPTRADLENMLGVAVETLNYFVEKVVDHG